jgi:membrane protease YdiL (CAAX protease family)
MRRREAGTFPPAEQEIAMSTADRPATPTPATTLPDPDFPLYDGTPARLSGGAWAAVLGAVVVGAACDLLLPVPGPAWLGIAVRGVLFGGIPLLVLHLVAPGTLGRLFRRLTGRGLALAAGFAAINVVATFLIGLAVATFTDAAANPMGGELAAQGGGERALTFLAMVPQLVGEEVFTIVLLLAVLTAGTSLLRLSRRSSLVLAVVVSSVLFAALHLPTYDWNVLQCLLIIGSARVILLVPYLLTKNITVSATAHVLNDWTLFGLGLASAALIS